MAKSRPFIINERFRLKELYMVEYLRNSRRSQSISILVYMASRLLAHIKLNLDLFVESCRSYLLYMAWS